MTARSRLSWLLPTVALAPFTPAAPAVAATFTVNSTVDAGDNNPNDGQCQTAAAQCTLRAAIQQADALGSTNTINVPAGVYGLTLDQLQTSKATNVLTVTGTGAAGTVVVDAGGLSRVIQLSGGTVTINNLVIQNGLSASSGGAAGSCNGAGVFVSGSTVAHINTSVIQDNVTPNATGAGICVFENATLHLADSTVRRNTASQGGAGIRLFPGASATIRTSTISDNRLNHANGGNGAGVETQGPLTIVNSTLSGNDAGTGGGSAIAVLDTEVRLTNVTISGNVGSKGQVESFEGTTRFESTIVANPIGGPNCLLGGDAVIISNGHNVESGDTCRFTAPGDRRDTDPLLGPLSWNGGPTRTHVLKPGSPAIGAADPATCPATDQRGVTRPQPGGGAGAGCDIGAYEVRGNAPLLLSAVLPTSRSVQVGTTATVFASVINVGPGTATGCVIRTVPELPGPFSFLTVDANNQITSAPDTPVDIAAGPAQAFLLTFTPAGVLPPSDVAFTFYCGNADPAPIVIGLNTLLLSASALPVTDIVALVATAGNDGIVNLTPIPGGFAGQFAVASVNVGAVGGPITVSADTGNAVLPIQFAICQTNPSTGACITPPGPTVATTIDPGATPTFSIFPASNQAIAFDPAGSRVFVRFKDAGDVTRGATSVAVRTQ